MKIIFKSKDAERMEIQTVQHEDGSFSSVLVPANPNTPEHYCVYVEPVEEKSFPGHAGRPGKVGGSLPRTSMPNASIAGDDRAKLLSTKEITKFLGMFGVTAGTINTLPDDLYDSIKSYVVWYKEARRTGKTSLPPSGPKLADHIGPEQYAKLQALKPSLKAKAAKAEASEFSTSTSAFVEKAVKFDKSVPPALKKLFVDTIAKYGVSQDVVKALRYVTAEPHAYSVDSNGEWYKPGEIDSPVRILGYCASNTPEWRSGPKNSFDIAINDKYSPESKRVTIIHELGHIAQHKYGGKSRKAFDKALGIAYKHLTGLVSGKSEYDRYKLLGTYGLRDYSLTNDKEFFADLYATIKYTETYNSKLEGLLGKDVVEGIKAA